MASLERFAPIDAGQHAHRFPRGEEIGGAVGDAGGKRSQRGEVVEDPDRAAVRAGDQIAILDHQIVKRRHRQIELEAIPVRAVVERNVEAGLGSGEEQTRLGGVGPDDAGEVVVGDAVVDPRPVLAVVAGDVEIGLEVVVLVAGRGDIDRAWSNGRGSMQLIIVQSGKRTA